ncbi:uncharacterized protein N7483_003951 [Penicillium malachiteum]|uniref:uncharacterized protein n=1 Tax=Penicillium malachiteum TaxID=1324776 RepID=UPI002547C33B|nr:uncharacterized protein N7483_003951 [Penicillium malachiteum]KAJ5729443.1 hypothetical protein N7483_003951 [Penicillium malachiteum]
MESLPPEILLLIGQNITDRSSIRALTECCWQFRHIFQPLYYSSIEIKKFSPKYHIPLVKHLYQRPDLARKVSFARFTWSTTCDGHDADHNAHESDEGDEDHDYHYDHDDHYEYDRVERLTLSTMNFIHDTLNLWLLDENLEHDDDPEGWRAGWEFHLFLGCSAAWIGLLIAKLTHVERLELCYHGQFDLMHQMLSRAVKRQNPFHFRTPFPLLQEVKLSCSYDNSWIHSHDALPFFYLPAVRVVEADGICETHNDPLFSDNRSILDFSGNDKPVSQVRAIKVSRAYNFVDMEEWIKACTKLEYLEVEAEITAWDISENYHFDAPTFRESLLLAKDTLKTIRFSFGKRLIQDRPGVFSPRAFDLNGLDNIPFGSFKEFHVLENLSIRYRNLSSRTFANLLPSSLKTLEIIDIKSKSFSRIMWNLAHLVESRGSFPNLNRIVLKHLGFSGKTRNEVDVDERSITGLDDPWVSGLGLGDLSIYLKNTCMDAGVSIKIYWSRVFDWGYLGF